GGPVARPHDDDPSPRRLARTVVLYPHRRCCEWQRQWMVRLSLGVLSENTAHRGDPLVAVTLPDPARSAVAIPPPGDGPGHWSGAPSAVLADGEIYLAFRLRRPVGKGRGYAV